MIFRGTWVAELVKRPTPAQVTISQFVSSSPPLGSVLTAQSLEGACFRFCVSFSLCPSPTCTLSVPQKLKKNVKKFLKIFKKMFIHF